MNGLRALRNAYNKSYDKKPLRTLCVTNCILGAVSDILAQSITNYDSRKKDKENNSILNLDEHLPENLHQHKEQWPESPKFDVWRTCRFALYNSAVGPVVGKWYMLLDRRFPMPLATSATRNLRDKMAIKRMITDQVLFAPVSLAVFFTTMALIESGRWQAVREKFRDAYIPALIANYKVWPLIQIINFKLMPLQYRLPFASCLGILWNAYLSWINNASKQEEITVERLQQML